jgi:hypothetical protein
VYTTKFDAVAELDMVGAALFVVEKRHTPHALVVFMPMATVDVSPPPFRIS